MPVLTDVLNPSPAPNGISSQGRVPVASADSVIVPGTAADSAGNNSVADHLEQLRRGAGHEGAFRWVQVAGPHTATEGSTTRTIDLSAAESQAFRNLIQGTLVARKFRVTVQENDAGTQWWGGTELLGPERALVAADNFSTQGLLAVGGGPWMVQIGSSGGATTQIVRVTLFPLGLRADNTRRSGAYAGTNRLFIHYRLEV